eukprot:465767-Rhodomonas_salina.1
MVLLFRLDADRSGGAPLVRGQVDRRQRSRAQDQSLGGDAKKDADRPGQTQLRLRWRSKVLL